MTPDRDPEDVTGPHEVRRGLALGDGVFRTLRVRSGKPLNWRWHWARLVADCEKLKLPAPDEAQLREDVAKVAPGDAVVKATITRGQAGRGYAVPTEVRTTRIVSAHPLPDHPADWRVAGVRVRRCHLVLSHQPRLAGIKTLNRLAFGSRSLGQAACGACGVVGF